MRVVFSVLVILPYHFEQHLIAAQEPIYTGVFLDTIDLENSPPTHLSHPKTP
jgi:hypothetical protein